MCISAGLLKEPFFRPFDTIEGRNVIKQSTPSLYNSSLTRRLEELAAIDELTRVLNRRVGMQRLQEEFNRTHRFLCACLTWIKLKP